MICYHCCIKCLHRCLPKSSSSKAFPAGGRPRNQEVLFSLPKQTRFPWLFASMLAKAGKATMLNIREWGWALGCLCFFLPRRKPGICCLTGIRVLLCLKPFLPVRRAFLSRSIWNEAPVHHFTLLCGHRVGVAAFVLESFIFHGGLLKEPQRQSEISVLYVFPERGLLFFWTYEICQVLLWKRKPK